LRKEEVKKISLYNNKWLILSFAKLAFALIPLSSSSGKESSVFVDSFTAESWEKYQETGFDLREKFK
jgi:hypothetical protein